MAFPEQQGRKKIKKKTLAHGGPKKTRNSNIIPNNITTPAKRF